jgi:Fe/S biogenesis protein NfuA
MASETPITITDAARRALLDLRARDPEPERLGLRIAVVGEGNGAYEHDMSFELLDEAAPGDGVFEEGGLPVIVPEDSVGKLGGATLDVAEAGGGWTIHNPNRPKRRLPLAPAAGGHAGHAHGGHDHAGHDHAEPSSPAVEAEVPEDIRASLTGDVAQKVATVLEQQVNPAIAMHGGRADLVGIRDETAFLRLGGGCQGCSMAAVTLRQGIETALRDLVPEIREIVDVTDHASGENPYYSASRG